MTIRLNERECTAGMHIKKVCEIASNLATASSDEVEFDFNGVVVTVKPGEDPDEVSARWHRDSEAKREAWLASPERAEMERKEKEELDRKMAADVVETAKTEEEMRAAKVPWPYTTRQLVQYIDSLVEREHDYGTCVYAMSMAAVAAFYYVSHRLEVTGFQASCADLDIIRRTRHLKGPFMIIDADKMLYPQYNIVGEVMKALKEWRPWAKKRAKELLADDGRSAADEVYDRWKRLASADVPEEEG